MKLTSPYSKSHRALNVAGFFPPIPIFAALVCLTVATSITARAQPVQLAISQDSSGLPGDLTLVWNSVPNATYRVQTTTNLSDPNSWQTLDAVLATNNTASYKIASAQSQITGAMPATAGFYRLLLPQPQIISVEPEFVNSSDSTAVLYLLGQLLPTNASVIINGQTFAPTIINSNGVWASVSLNGLPPGTAIGSISVVDNGTGTTVATLPVQSPIVYGTASSNEQLQGPPDDDPPARPSTMNLKVVDKNGACTDSQIATDGDTRTAGGHAWNNTPPRKTAAGARYVLFTNGNHFGENTHPHARLASGEFVDCETDLAVPGLGLDFVWTRTYHSRTGSNTAQGAGWDFSYDVSLAAQPNGTILLSTGDGRSETFYPNGTNGWARDEYFVQVGDLNGDGMPDVLFADGSKWLFNPLGTAAGGKLWQIIDRNGNTMTLSYDTSGRLSTMLDDLGRTYTISYNSSGQIASVTDFSSRSVTYQYDTSGNLTACVSPPVTGTPTGNDFPGGKTNSYTYSSGFSDDRLNHNLTSMTDAKGQTWLQIVYQSTTDPTSIDFDAVDHIQRGSYTEYLRRYTQTPSPTNQFATVDCLACDSVGNVTECFFDSRQRCLRELDYTGRSNPALPVTQTDNRPTSQLRSTDPTFFETDCAWNNDSLCTAMYVNPRSIARQQYCIYQRDLTDASDPRHKGDLRVARDNVRQSVDTDGDGTPDTTQRSWFFTYDPRFGSPAQRYCVQYRETAFNFVSRLMEEEGIFYLFEHGENRTPPSRISYGDGGSSDTPVESFAVRRKGWDGTIKGRFTAEGNGMAIKTKGTGADKNRGIKPRGWDGTIKGLVVAEGNGMAIKTKGTGADKNRTIKPGGWDGTIKGRGVVVQGWDPLNKKAINTKGTGATLRGTVKGLQLTSSQPTIIDNKKGLLMDFCLSVTDPNGVPTTATYDTRGNRVKVQFPWDRSEADFAYNSHGQCVAVTNEPDGNGYRSVDAFLYFTNGTQSGFLQSATADALGFATTTTYQYDVRANVTRCVDPLGRDCLFTYNALDQIVTCQTPTNINSRCMTDCIYDANNNLVQTTTELRDYTDTLQYTVTQNYNYDILDRCVTVVDQVATNHFITNGIVYDGNDNVTALYSPLAMSGADPNNYTALQYDERDFLWKQVDGPLTPAIARTNQWDYDYDGNCTTMTAGGASGPPHVTTCAYDGFDRCIRATDAMGNVESAVLSRVDLPVRVSVYGETIDVPGSAGNHLLAQAAFQYDSLYRPISMQQSRFDAAGNNIGNGFSLSTFTYAPNGQLLHATDDNQHTTSYNYDTLGRCSQVTDARKDVVNFAYDACDNLIGTTSTEASDLSQSSEQFSMTYTYDSRDRCLTSTDNVGNTTSCAYDSLDRLVRQLDPNGNLSGATYDDLGRYTVTIADLDRDGILDFALDPKNVLTWDDNSRCIAGTDANTNTTLFAYDSLDQCLSVTYADGTASQFTWDCFGGVITMTDATGSSITNTYNLRENIIHRDLAARNVLLETTTFEGFAYDGLSRLVAASNDISVSTFAYDSLGDCLATTQDGLATTCAYDGVGNLLSMTYPSGRGVTYTLDAINQVTSVGSSGGGLPPVTLASYAYEGPGRPGRITRANGVNTRINWDGIVSSPNAAGDFGWGEPVTITHASAANGKQVIIDKRQFTYDADQNKTSRLQTAPFFSGGPELTNGFAYDALDRMTVFTHASGSSDDYSNSYVLDGVGNRLFVDRNGVPFAYTMSNAIPPGDFQMDRYTTTPFGSQTYDADGDLALKASSTQQLQYQYDCANRLVAVNDLTSGSSMPVATFGYDALGRRVSKTVYPPSPLAPVTTQYILGVVEYKDGEDMTTRHLEERVGGTVGRDYVVMPASGRKWEDDVGDVVMPASGRKWEDDTGIVVMPASGRKWEDDIVGVVVAFTSTGSPQYYHNDDLGNVLALTDPSGTVLERTDYDDFGHPTFLSSDGSPLVDGTGQPLASSSQGNPFQFQGNYWDGETGLYYRKYKVKMGSAQSNPLYEDSKTGRPTTRPWVPVNPVLPHYFIENNPWSAGGGGGGGAMKKNGTIKFFNESKGFGFR